MLALLALLLGPVSLYSDYLSRVAGIESFGVELHNNGSLQAVLSRTGAWTSTGPGRAAILLLELSAIVLCYMRVRRTDDDRFLWAAGWLFVLIATPVVWWHYLWLAVPALLLGWGRSPSTSRERMVLVALGGILVMTLATASSHFNSIAQFAVLCLAVGVTVSFATGSSSAAPDRADART